MDTLRCRAYTRQKVIQRTRQVGRLEKRVTEATQKINAVSEENKRYTKFLASDILLKWTISLPTLKQDHCGKPKPVRSVIFTVMKLVQASDQLSQEIERMQSMLRSREDMEAQLETALRLYKSMSWTPYIRIIMLTFLIGKLAEHWRMNEELEKVTILNRRAWLPASLFILSNVFVQTSSSRDLLILNDLTKLREASQGRYQLCV